MTSPDPAPTQPTSAPGEPWYFSRLREYEERLEPIRSHSPEVADGLEALAQLVGDLLVHGFNNVETVLRGEQDLNRERDSSIDDLANALSEQHALMRGRVELLERRVDAGLEEHIGIHARLAALEEAGRRGEAVRKQVMAELRDAIVQALSGHPAPPAEPE